MRSSAKRTERKGPVTLHKREVSRGKGRIAMPKAKGIFGRRRRWWFGMIRAKTGSSFGVEEIGEIFAWRPKPREKRDVTGTCVGLAWYQRRKGKEKSNSSLSAFRLFRSRFALNFKVRSLYRTHGRLAVGQAVCNASSRTAVRTGRKSSDTGCEGRLLSTDGKWPA